MPKCSECGTEITHLISYQEGERKATFYLDEEGKAINMVSDFIENDACDADYECPECKKTIFTSEEDAIRFLSSKTGKKYNWQQQSNGLFYVFEDRIYRVGTHKRFTELTDRQKEVNYYCAVRDADGAAEICEMLNNGSE